MFPSRPRYVLDLMLVDDGGERTMCCGVLDPTTSETEIGMALVAMFGPYSASNALTLIAQNLTDSFPEQYANLSFALDSLTIVHIMNLKRGTNLSGRDYPDRVHKDT